MPDTPAGGPPGPVTVRGLPYRPSRIDQFKGVVADLARPIAIISTSGASSWAIIDIAQRVSTAEGGAMFVGVVLSGLSALYVGKAFENTRIAGHQADVEKAKAASGPSTPAQIPAAPEVEATLRGIDGELPVGERLNP